MQPVACLLAKGRPQHIPSQTDTVVRFVQEHVAVFLCLHNLASKGRHKATTHDCIPQGEGYDVCSGACQSLILLE